MTNGRPSRTNVCTRRKRTRGPKEGSPGLTRCRHKLACAGSEMLFASHLEQLKPNEPVDSWILEDAWRLEQLLNLCQ
jgi:hypothetical protein